MCPVARTLSPGPRTVPEGKPLEAALTEGEGALEESQGARGCAHLLWHPGQHRATPQLGEARCRPRA